jgi:diguanylate cyclase (GGDEF)-like protein
MIDSFRQVNPLLRVPGFFARDDASHGGIVPDTITGEQLQDLFRTEMWRDHFAALSESLGFSLSIYSQAGTLIFAPPGPFPLCPEFRSATSSFTSHCDAQCLTHALNTLSTNKPDVFSCFAKIVSFAVPIEHLGDRAVILGQGSFSSYRDFREFINTVSHIDLDTISIPVPTSFTSFEQAWKASGFVEDSVRRLLKNTQETVSLRKKFERLKDIIGRWGALDEGRPEALYEHMICKLAALLDLDHVSILVEENKQGIYTNRSGPSNDGGTRELVTISDHDAVVLDLTGGKAFVHAPDPQDSLGGRKVRYFFPVMVNGKLEGILYTAGRDLTEADRQVISSFCRQAGLSLENRRLQHKLSRKFERFAAIAELTKSITPIQNYETLTRTILDLSAHLLKAEQGSLMLIDQETDALFLEARKGVVEGIVDIRINRGEGIAGRVAKFGEPILVEDLENDPRINQKNRHNYKTRSFVSVPLKIDERIIGVLNLSDKVSGEVFNEDDLSLIQSFATQAAIVMERQVFINKTEELKKLTITDPLTGLLNRRYLSERLKNELARAERHLHPLSLLMLDLDGFKKCNDSHGHLFGDSILKNIAEILFHTVRSMDIVARYGGDEFMVILPETGEPLAVDIAERMRGNIMRKVALPPDIAAPGPHALTASIGVACFPEHGDTVELLLENVDKALYRAKNKGKNRVEVFS